MLLPEQVASLSGSGAYASHVPAEYPYPPPASPRPHLKTARAPPPALPGPPPVYAIDYSRDAQAPVVLQAPACYLGPDVPAADPALVAQLWDSHRRDHQARMERMLAQRLSYHGAPTTNARYLK